MRLFKAVKIFPVDDLTGLDLFVEVVIVCCLGRPQYVLIFMSFLVVNIAMEARVIVVRVVT